MEQRIFDIIFKEDEVTWQSLLYELVKSENMDVWNIDVSELSQKYIEMLKKMQEMDLRVSGKVVLAAAILLKFKSDYLLENDFLNFDKLMHPEDYIEDDLYDNQEKVRPDFDINKAKLIPKTPQPRKRKVSIFELVEALKQALEVKKRRREILEAIPIPMPGKKVDIGQVIEELYASINKLLTGNDSITFRELVPSDKKEDIISLFLPLLHLSNQQKVDLDQQVHFGDIDVSLHSVEKNEKKKTASATNEAIDFNKKHDFVEDALEESTKKRRK